MLEGNGHCAVEMFFSCVELFIDRATGLGVSCDLTGGSVQSIVIVNTVVVRYRDAQWVEGELSKQRSRDENFKRVDQEVPAPLHVWAICLKVL